MIDSKVDINCDVGEGRGALSDRDRQLFALLTSCSISCGAHAGDTVQIQQSIETAMYYKLRLGAHPSYPDREGFGRRKLNISITALKASLIEQIRGLKSMVETQGATLQYVKPHGALYNTMATDARLSLFFYELVQNIDPRLSIMGLAGSVMQKTVENAGGNFIAEAFLDRRYSDNGQLLPRKFSDAVIEEPEQVYLQFKNLLFHKKVQSINQVSVSVDAQSFCLHADHKNTLEILRYLKKQMSD